MCDKWTMFCDSPDWQLKLLHVVSQSFSEQTSAAPLKLVAMFDPTVVASVSLILNKTPVRLEVNIMRTQKLPEGKS